jgi:hypothetical protein
MRNDDFRFCLQASRQTGLLAKHEKLFHEVSRQMLFAVRQELAI